MQPLAGTSLQSAAPGTALPLAPAVVVLDQQGQPVANVEVVFRVTSGGGQVTPPIVSTDVNGIAATSGWVLGPAPGANTLTASLSGVAPVTFAAIGGSGTGTVTPFQRINGLTGRPFGVVALAREEAYVTRQDVNALTRVNAASLTFSTSATVGANPSDAVLTDGLTSAYTSDVLGNSVSVVNLQTNTTEAIISLGTSVFRVAASPDGQFVYATTNDGHVAAIQTSTRRVLSTITLSGPLNGILVSGNGQMLYVSSMSGTVFRVDSRTGQVFATQTVGGTAQEVVLSPDGRELYVANEGGWVDVLDPTTLAPITRIMAPAAFGMRLSPDGATLYVSGARLGRVYLIDRATRTLRQTLEVGGFPRRIAFTATRRALVANEGGWVDYLP